MSPVPPQDPTDPPSTAELRNDLDALRQTVADLAAAVADLADSTVAITPFVAKGKQRTVAAGDVARNIAQNLGGP